MPISRPLRRASRLGAALTAAGVIAMALTGCMSGPAPSPTPTQAEAAPIFATDEEALAAAQAAYAAHLARVDELTTHSGGTDFGGLEGVATDQYAASIVGSLDRMREQGTRTEGKTSFDSIELVEHDQIENTAHVTVYLCLDVSGVHVFDSAGSDITPTDRLERAPIQLFFESSPEADAQLVVAGAEPWSGDNFC